MYVMLRKVEKTPGSDRMADRHVTRRLFRVASTAS